MKATSGCIACIQCIGGLAWFIVGQVWRWRYSGMICGGISETPTMSCVEEACNVGQESAFKDVPGSLIKSANFIQVWLIVVYSTCACCICLAIFGACFTKKNN